MLPLWQITPARSWRWGLVWWSRFLGGGGAARRAVPVPARNGVTEYPAGAIPGARRGFGEASRPVRPDPLPTMDPFGPELLPGWLPEPHPGPPTGPAAE